MLSWLPRERSDEASGLSIYYVAKNRHCVRSKSEFIFEVGQMSSEFPKRLPEKLIAIRQRYDLRAAAALKSLDAETIQAYENGDTDLPVSVLLAYALLAGIPIENLIYDDRDLWFGHRMN